VWETASTILTRLSVPGGGSAWNALDASFRHPIERYGRRRGLGEAEAEDLVQETLVVLAEALRLGRYDREKGPLRGYLFGIVRNRMNEMMRSSWRARVQRERDLEETGAILRAIETSSLEPDDPWEEEWRQFVLERALTRIQGEVAVKTYELFHAHALEGLTAGETAERFGVPKAQVYNVKNRVMQRVRDLMTEFEDA